MGRPSRGAWFRAHTGSWYATVAGKAVALGVYGRNNVRQAQEAFVRVTSGGPVGPPSAVRLTVRRLVEAFLTAAARRLKPNTLRIYRYDADRFAATFGDRPADAIDPTDIHTWAVALPVGDTTRAMTLRSLAAVFSWGVKTNRLATNPVAGVPRPKCKSRGRSAVISDADHAKLLEAASPFFRDVLRVLHGTGCRPGEAAALTVEAFDRTAGAVTLTEHKTDRDGSVRVIYLTPELVERLSALADRVGSGAILRTKFGGAWTGRSITYMMQKVRKKAGVRTIAYGYRHTFATDALSDGVPDAQVAALLGHKSTTVLHKNYAHLGERSRALRVALNRVRAGG